MQLHIDADHGNPPHSQVAILSCINITQCILYAVPFDVPSFTFFTAALTIDLGLQQLIIEADTVNGVVSCRVDEYEPKSFLSERRRALRKGESVGGTEDIERVNDSDAASTRDPSGDMDGASKAASSRGWGSSVPLVDMSRKDGGSSRLEVLDVPRLDAASSSSEHRPQSSQSALSVAQAFPGPSNADHSLLDPTRPDSR